MRESYSSATAPRRARRSSDSRQSSSVSRRFESERERGRPRALAADLRGAIEGEVRFDTGSRALYATDASNYRMPPIGVVVPRHVDELVEIHRVCREHGAPIVLRGGGTSLAGQGCNTAVLIDFSKYLHRHLEIDPERRTARVQPGCVLDHLRGTAGEKYGLTFGPDPSTHAYCTLGGMLGNNSCGRTPCSRSSTGRGRGSRTTSSARGADVPRRAAADRPTRKTSRALSPEARSRESTPRCASSRPRTPTRSARATRQIPRRVSGYNLDELLPEKGFQVARSLVGTESTCVTVLEATLELIPKPRCVSLLVVGYPDKYRTADHVPLAREHKPISIEGMDDTLIEDMTLLGIHQHERSMLPDGGGWLFVEFGGDTKDESDDKARALMRDLEKAGQPPSGLKLYDDPDAEQHIWERARGQASARPRSSPASPTPTRGGRTRPSRLSGSASICDACPRSRSSTTTRARSTATTARAASTRAGTSTSSRSPA